MAPTPTPEEVLAWLKLLNRPENNRVPDLSIKEDERLREYRRREPEFSVAAVSWHQHAGSYWDELKPEILLLFRLHESNHNFKQWVLEFARETYPGMYKSCPMVPMALRNLARDLLGGKVTPLHMAAVLGIERLVEYLRAPGQCPDAINLHTGVWGSPLFCALMGPGVLETGTKPSYWTDMFRHSFDSDRGDAVLFLSEDWRDPEAQFAYSIQNPPAETEDSKLPQDFLDTISEASLSGLALSAAVACKDKEIFTVVVKNTASIDKHFLLLLDRARDVFGSGAHWMTFRYALEYLFNLAVRQFQGSLTLSRWPWLEDPQVSHGFWSILATHDLTELFASVVPAPRPVYWLSDLDYQRAVVETIVSRQSIAFRSLMDDPRFNPNLEVSRSSDTRETIAHLAVSGNHFGVVRMLIEAGADFSRVDDGGRTPLLVVEDPKMLDWLRLQEKFPLLLSLSATDSTGCNLWHYACATNDAGLIDWLCEHDRGRDQHLRALTLDTRSTPLEEGLASIKELEGMVDSVTLTTPRGLLRVLEEMRLLKIPAPPHLDLKLAVSWGNAAMVEGLEAIGADFGCRDAEGNTLLHHLGMLATKGLVEKLLSILGPDADLFNARGQSPAEAVIANVLAQFPDDFPDESFAKRHAGELDHGGWPAFRALLRDDIPRRGIWERTSEMVVAKMRCLSTAQRLPPISLEQSLEIIFRILIEVGAVREYELEKGHSAIKILHDDTRYEGWHVSKARTWLKKVLESCDKTLLKETFYTTDSAFDLLREASHEGDWDLVAHLAETGMPLDTPHPQLDNGGVRPLVELVLGEDDDAWYGDSQEDFESMLPSPMLKHFLAHPALIYNFLISPLPVELDPIRKLRLLLDRGLDPNPKHVYPLVRSIMVRRMEVTQVLLDYGADPSVGPPGGRNAFLALAGTAEVTLMGDVIRVLQEKENEFDWGCEYDDEATGGSLNALQAAAAGGHERMLLLLLRCTPLGEKVDEVSSSNGRTAAQVAFDSGRVGCLEVLRAQGADMSFMEDPKGLDSTTISSVQF